MGTAVLVVDVQRALVEPPHDVVGADGLVTRLGRLLDRARSAGVPVIHVQDDGDADPVIERGTPGWELVLPVLDGDVVVAKTGDDAFDGTDLSALLTSLGADTVVVVGIQSEMCVLATARTAQSRGLSVVLPRGGHATYDVPADPPDAPAVPAAHVARVVEWSLGDQVRLPDIDELDWPSGRA